jgi:predicted PurR-regulated permease PerM
MPIFKDLKGFPEFRLLIIVLLLITGGYLIGMIWGVLAHFGDLLLLLLLAWLLSFILEPLIVNLSKFSFSRAAASLLVYGGLVVFLLIIGFLIIPSVLIQMTTLASVLPGYFINLPAWLNRFQDVIISAIGTSVNFISLALSFFFSLFVVIILSFYFSLDRPRIGREFLSLVPRDFRDEAMFVSGVINHTFAQFFRVQVVLGIISGFLTWIVMLILTVRFAATAAVLAGIFTIIPLVGPFLALIPPVLLGFLETPTKGWLTLILLIVLQQMEFNILGPKMLGSALKINPIIVLLSFLVGYKLAGAWGSLFAVPVVSILVIIGKELWRHWIIESNYPPDGVGSGAIKP